jgi:hypothetical protein
MHGRTPQYNAFWIPDDFDPDEAIVLGAAWLLQQAGEPLILLNTKSSITNNSALAAVAGQYRMRYEAPTTMHRTARWGGGAILAPWARDKVIECIDDDLAFKTEAVCVIGWIPGSHDAWIAARGAVNLVDGQRIGPPISAIISDPVVRIAIDDAEGFVNHNNQLVQAEDKAYLINTLKELLRGSHGLELDEICSYAMATGWSGKETERIREYGERLLQGRDFRLRSNIGPKPGACERWEAEAAEAAGS